MVVVFIVVGLISSSDNDSSSQSASENTSENVGQANESNKNTTDNVGQANESAKFNAAETPTAVNDCVLVGAKMVETNSKGHDFVYEFTLDYEFNERNQKTKMTTQLESDTYNSLGDFQTSYQFNADDTVVFPNLPEGDVEEYTYDDNGFLMKKSVDGLIDYSYDYEYENGLLKWAFTDRYGIEYLYDENNILSNVVYYQGSGYDVPIVEVSCYHNTKGEIINCSIESDDTANLGGITGTAWSGYGVSEMLLSYNDDGNLARVSYTKDYGDNVYDWTITYEYMSVSQYLSSHS